MKQLIIAILTLLILANLSYGQVISTPAWLEMRFDDAAIFRRSPYQRWCNPFPPNDTNFTRHWAVNLHKPCGTGSHEITAFDGSNIINILPPITGERWFLTFEIDYNGIWEVPCVNETSGWWGGIWLWCNDGVGTFGCDQFGSWSIQAMKPRSFNSDNHFDDPEWYFTPEWTAIYEHTELLLDGILEGVSGSFDLNLLHSENTRALIYIENGNDLVLWIGDPRRHTDFNFDGDTNVSDIFMYLMCWFNNDNRADFNRDDVINVSDLFDYLNMYFTE